MSYTQHTSVATLTLSGATCPSDVVNLYIDWISNHKDDAPEELLDYTAEELSAELLPYIECDEHGNVVVKLDTEGDGNYNSDFFNSVTDHLCGIMSSRLMEVNWTCYDSRDGLSSRTNYYDSEGLVEPLKDAEILDNIANLMSGQDWDTDLLDKIAGLIRSTGRIVDDVF
ncbi:MAG: hypothetical protein EB075_13695 [Bacteroidetes bacterium]|nr:hypothetical protein [Bacteroidota bacterium]